MPCDSVTTIKTVFKFKQADKLLAAAKKLGLRAVKLTDHVIVHTSGGLIKCFEGRSEMSGFVANETAEALMKGYASEVFSAWSADYTYFEETSRTANSREYAFVNQ